METNTKKAVLTAKFVDFIVEASRATDYLTPTLVNHGGCGAFADALVTELKELGYEPNIYALYYSPHSADAETNLKNYLKQGTNLAQAGEDHVVVELCGKYFDSTGQVHPKSIRNAREKVLLTHEQLEAVVDKGEWNPTFDRRTIPFIHSTLHNYFEEYDESKYKWGRITREASRVQVTFTPHTMQWRQKMCSPFNDLQSFFSNLIGQSDPIFAHD